MMFQKARSHKSTVEAEYVVVVAAVNQALWIRKLMANLFIEQNESTQILVDNQAASSIANNLVSHGKTKHFKLKLYFLGIEGGRNIACLLQNRKSEC